MDGQVRMGETEFVVEPLAYWSVYRVPEGAAIALDLREVGGCDVPGRAAPETGLCSWREGGTEGVEAVDGAWNAIEGDTLQSNLPYQLSHSHGIGRNPIITRR